MICICTTFAATPATHCNTLHHTATHCNTLQHTMICICTTFAQNVPKSVYIYISTHVHVCVYMIWGGYD